MEFSLFPLEVLLNLKIEHAEIFFLAKMLSLLL